MTINSLEAISVDDCDLTYMTCYRKYHNGAARASEASRAATARNGKKRKIKLKKRNKIFDTMYPSMSEMDSPPQKTPIHFLLDKINKEEKIPHSGPTPPLGVGPSGPHGGPIVLKPFPMNSPPQKTLIHFLSTKFNKE